MTETLTPTQAKKGRFDNRPRRGGPQADVQHLAGVGTLRAPTDTGRRIGGIITACGLGAATVLHGAWATGSTWPATDRDRLADLVVGSRPFPGPALVWTVTALLGAATTVTAASATTSGADTRSVQLGARTVAAALLARGISGFVMSGAGLGGSTPQYCRYDLRFYSPLCLALGGTLAATTRTAIR